jgi:DNA-binding response OmpR family regulator
MPTVLAIAPGTPPALEGRSLFGDQLDVEISRSAARFLAEAPTRVFDLLVLTGLSVDDQQDLVGRFQQHRRWRLVPVLYVFDGSARGYAVPGCYRPELDSMISGTLESPQVQRRIRAMAREGIATADLVVAGPFELDPIRCLLRLTGGEVALTEREAEILAILLSQPNRTVAASEIIERGWGTEADTRYLQILRRHVSNIRRKLYRTPAARSVRTVRGAGYRFEVKLAS